MDSGGSSWLKSSHYQTRVAPGTWLRGQAMQTNDGGYEERIDARAPFAVTDGTATTNWNLPSFSFEDASCELPHTCSLTARGSGWLPEVPVAIYLVSQAEFPNGRPSGWFTGHGAIDSPERADASAQMLIVEIQPDAQGHFDGTFTGQGEVTVASMSAQQTSGFAAVQRTSGVFKMAQPTTGFSLPDFNPFSILTRPALVVPLDLPGAPSEIPSDDTSSQP